MEVGYEIHRQQPVQADLLDALDNIRVYCAGRCFFVAGQTEVCGLAPKGAQQGDVVAIMLGCKTPMVLRPLTARIASYQLIEEAYCDGFTHGEALLDRLPDAFTAILGSFDNGTCQLEWAYFDTERGTFQAEDPRLGPLPPGWEIESHLDEEFFQLFRNIETGKQTRDDPRLTSDFLRKRGIPLQVLNIV